MVIIPLQKNHCFFEPVFFEPQLDRSTMVRHFVPKAFIARILPSLSRL